MSKLGSLIWETMIAIGDEEKEACIHCGTVWYRIHHRDGVCHRCQAQGLPSRTQLAKNNRLIRWLLTLGSIFLILAGYAIYTLVTT